MVNSNIFCLLQASELQNNMMEMMDAAELEKQKHNNTRMEALARMAKLEVLLLILASSLIFSLIPLLVYSFPHWVCVVVYS